METWDNNIQRVQEIQQLLANRQQYFSGQWNTISYQSNREGNKGSMKYPSAKSSDVSLGQSIEAQLGSLESDDFSFHKESTRGESKPKMNECSLQKSRISVKRNTSIKTERTSKKLSEWVSKNVKQALTPITGDKVVISDKNTKTFTNSRRRSVSFRRNSFAAEDPFTNSEKSEEFRRKPKVKLTNPLELLKSKSWLLRAEAVNRNPSDKNVLKYITKGTLSHAREKLINAEKSLQLVIEDVSQPLRRSVINKTQTQEILKERLVPVKKTVSRLAIRQAEEAIKSDLNLREAFALIKINPDPIIKLASVDNMAVGKNTTGQKSVNKSESNHKKQGYVKNGFQTQKQVAIKPNRTDDRYFKHTKESPTTNGTLQSIPFQMRLSLLGAVSKKKDGQSSRKNSCSNVRHQTNDCSKGSLDTMNHLNTSSVPGYRQMCNDRQGPKLVSRKLDYTTGGFPIESHYSVDKLAGTVL